MSTEPSAARIDLLKDDKNDAVNKINNNFQSTAGLPGKEPGTPTATPQNGCNNNNNNNTSSLTININAANNNNNANINMLSPEASSTSSSTHDPTHDLPPALFQQGWRVVWSKREQRPYYFNKTTNESLWEMPPLTGEGGDYDPLTDPLGISAPEQNHKPLRIGEKRSSSSSSDDPYSGTHKKFILSGPWDLEVTSNVIIWERAPVIVPHPHPDIEILRLNYLMKLRSQYQEMCHTRENIDAPRESFNRWLIERKTIDKGADPVLPSNCVPEISRSLYNEIITDIPIRLTRPKFGAEARKQLSRYAEAAKKMIESRNASPESRRIVKWSVEEAFQWIRKTLNATFEDYEERLKHLRTQCQPHLTEAAKSSVEGICSKLYHLSCSYVKKINEAEKEILKKDEIPEITAPLRPPKPKKVYCYSLQLAYRCPKYPPIQYHPEKDFVLVKYKTETLRLKPLFLQKMEHLYRYNCYDDKKFDIFLPRLFCLLKRYQVFLGNPQGEGVFTQVSLPKTVFACLNRLFGVTFECFASPLNCYFRQYCSAYGDVDGFFGSRGSMLNFFPIGGSFQAFPPYSDQLMEAIFDHFERLLANTSDPLSFIIFIPEYKENPISCLYKIELSVFKRAQITISANDYELRNGYQHICEPNQLHFKPNVPMMVIFLQNEPGFTRWGPNSQKLEELTNSFKMAKESSKDKDIGLLSPPPTPGPGVSTSTESSSKDSTVKEAGPQPITDVT
ncbi:phosphorylated CTD-interacting factor 1 [Tetranychus urticae]|uniref:WW domain-containing protein n=1 Tax=Tetranychus urticae TaxID=32264 RepID=T1KCF0_TETUR|nr:phosphorylated CTD-interacting factor 1 [Tetranychus urticae]